VQSGTVKYTGMFQLKPLLCSLVELFDLLVDVSQKAKEKLVDLDQRAQEDWYAKWVSELVRIVKPGRPVLIENVGFPFCVDFEDYGGVSKEWWKLAVSKYEWDIDVDSILIKDNSDGRYDVSMRRNTRAI